MILWFYGLRLKWQKDKWFLLWFQNLNWCLAPIAQNPCFSCCPTLASYLMTGVGIASGNSLQRTNTQENVIVFTTQAWVSQTLDIHFLFLFEAFFMQKWKRRERNYPSHHWKVFWNLWRNDVTCAAFNPSLDRQTKHYTSHQTFQGFQAGQINAHSSPSVARSNDL